MPSSRQQQQQQQDLPSLKMQSLDLNASDALFTPSTPATLNASPPDFDFNMPCRYFKSSFARSLSLSNASKSLDYDINNYQRNYNCSNTAGNIGIDNVAAGQNDGPPLPQRLSRAGTPAATYCHSSASNNNNNQCNGQFASNKNEVSTNTPPPAIPARRPQQQQHQHLPPLTQFRHAAASNGGNAPCATAAAAAAAGGTARGHINKVINHTLQKQQQQQHAPRQQPSNSTNNIFSKNVWPRDIVQQDCNLCDETEHETIAQPAALDYDTPVAAARTTTTEHRTPFEVHDSTMNVEAVILRNQVDTLQWQLKQVETSCEMYRAVMEEVARFLDRYHNQKQEQQHQRQLLQQSRNGGTEQISRSKSLYHVYGEADGAAVDGGHEKAAANGDEKNTTQLRARSSTNLIDLKLSSPAGALAIDHDDRHYDALAPANSYSAFKDFTWRRSPKKLKETGRPHTPANDVEEKLNQEAFRLSRTIHNLLNTSTQQPDLTQHRNSLAAVSLGRLGKAPSSSALTLHAPMHNSTSLTSAAANSSASSVAPSMGSATAKTSLHASSLAAEMLFLRSANMRDSRLSLRSSTDSSVHSASSCAASSSSVSSSCSKVETDEEHTHFLHTPPPLMGGKQLPPPALCSTTEDESGFSSISSFQDIGVPLSSTLLSSAPLSSRQLQHVDANEPHSLLGFNVESRNSTLKATTADATHPTNVVGVPLQPDVDMQHRWDSPSKTYRNAHKLQRFSTLSNEDPATVLWV